MTGTQTIPQAAADRYLATLADFVSAARSAIAATPTPQSAVWQRKLLPDLESRLALAQTAVAHHAIGNEEPLAAHALQSRFLARDTDGYPLNFAGEELAAQLRQKRQYVVYAAWQVAQFAGAV